MKKITIAIVIICCFAFFNLADKDRVFKKLYALEGTWKMNGKRGAVYEEWKKVNKNLLQGRSYFIKEADTVVSEHIKLTNDAGSIYYTPVVEDQNNKQPIAFKMTRAKNRSFVFENDAHDFPKRIVYTFITADSIYAFVDDGTDNGKRQNFYYKRQ